MSVEQPPSQVCDSCIERPNCKDDLKDNTSLCPKWHTKIVELFDGSQVAFQCIPNGVQSEWHDREEFEEPEAIEKVAQQLHVKPKSIWLLLINDNVPKPKLPSTFPSFHFDEENPPDKAEIRFKVASWLMENHHFLSFPDTDELYLYNDVDGIYEPEKGVMLVAEAVRMVLQKYATIYDVNETRAAIRDSTVRDRSILNLSEPEICVLNGVLNILTLELTPHTPTKVFLKRIPVKYDPQATCPNIDAFLKQVLPENDVTTVFEEAGYALDPGYYIHKGFVFVGEGANGKSTWLNVMTALFGPENCSHVSLQELEHTRFAKAALVGKIANIYPDLSAEALHHTGAFKMWTGGDAVGCEYKFGKHFEHKPETKLFFSANILPESPDDTTAFFRRWIITAFTRIFTNFSEPKADPHLINKLTTPTELSGLLNKALKGLRNLRERGFIYGDQASSAWREDYIRKSDPIAAFVLDCLLEINKQEYFITKADLYQKFVVYCNKSKLPAADSPVFSRKIKGKFELAIESTAEVENKRKKVWRNLTWSKNGRKFLGIPEDSAQPQLDDFEEEAEE